MKRADLKPVILPRLYSPIIIDKKQVIWYIASVQMVMLARLSSPASRNVHLTPLLFCLDQGVVNATEL
jgi:hypothetical protein